MSAFVIDPITVAGEGATRASTATYINSAGKVAVAAANELRFSYDPLDLDAPPVVLVERAPAVNLLRYPRNFDNAVWSKLNAPAVPNSGLAPDGTLTADRIVPSTVSGEHIVYASPAATINTYTLSVVAQSSGYNYCAIRIDDGAVQRVAIFNIANGTVVTKSNVTKAEVLPLPDASYRISITITGSVTNVVFAPLPTSALTFFAGDGVSGVYLWHAQLEVGSKATSIIPDATAFVSRASNKWEFNSAGALAQSAADVAVTAYDPVTLLSRGLSLEAAARNEIRNSVMGGAVAGMPGTMPTNALLLLPSGLQREVKPVGAEDGIDYCEVRIFGTASVSGQINLSFETNGAAATIGQSFVQSKFVRVVGGSLTGLSFRLTVDQKNSGGSFVVGGPEVLIAPTSAALRSQRYSTAPATITNATTATVTPIIYSPVSAGAVIDVTLRIGLPQLEQGAFPTSPIKTAGAAVTRAADISTSPPATRAADVLGTGTLLYSNVPETEYPTYSATGVYGFGERVIYAHEVHEQVLGSSASVTLSIADPCVVTHPAHGFANGQPVKLTTTGALPTGLTAGATYYVVNTSAGAYQLSTTVGGAAINTSGTQSGVHTLTANAIGQTPGPDSLYWTRKSVSNQRMMFDEFNNTASINADVIRVALQPRAVAGGLYLGGLVGADVRVSMVEPNGSMVYSKTVSLLRPTTGVSYYNWMFSRIKRTTMAVLSDLPAYYDGVMMVEIRNPGAMAACAMLGLGPLTDLGLSQYGVSRDITDYSSETFDVDGSSETIPRGYSKGMDLDIVVYNEDIDELTELVESFHQRFLIWIASEAFRLTVVAGKYNSFKTVIVDYPTSRMSLSIKGKI